MKTFKQAGDQLTEVNLSANRPHLFKLIGLGLGVIFMGFTLGGCDFGKFDASAETTSKEKSNMESIQSTTTVQHEIPPIDAAVLPGIETATFAMG